LKNFMTTSGVGRWFSRKSMPSAVINRLLLSSLSTRLRLKTAVATSSAALPCLIASSVQRVVT